MQTWNYIAALIGGACGLLLFVQDWRTRTVHLLPLLLFGIAGAFAQREAGTTVYFQSRLGTLAIVALLLACVLLYQFLKEGSLRGIFSKMGEGDFIMLAAVSFWMSFPFFLFWLAAANVILLTGALAFQFSHSGEQKFSIPLAGCLALLALPGYALDQFFFHAQFLIG